MTASSLFSPPVLGWVRLDTFPTLFTDSIRDLAAWNKEGVEITPVMPVADHTAAHNLLQFYTTATPFNFSAHLARQRDWSRQTFGPGARTAGIVDHIRKELTEIQAAPDDISEWIDVAILALDGAWRAGAGPEQIIEALVAKQTKNEARDWPDWRSADPDKAIEHDRSGEAKHAE
jgi:hypothetical protein